MAKIAYRGAFNYRQTAIIIYRSAFSKRQAWKLMCDELARRDGVHPSVVYNLFNGEKDNFTIEEEK